MALNKPRRIKKGEPGYGRKEFVVEVRTGEDKTKNVYFGDPNMENRSDNPDARKNFRARHNCDTAKDKTTARYWACRSW
jgi:hypothetical protein